MSFLDRLRGGSGSRRYDLPEAWPERPTLTLPKTEAVGESFYEDAIRQVAPSGAARVVCVLRPEPRNPHDRRAVGVLGPGAHKIGHLSREDARGLRSVVDAAWRDSGVAAVEAVVATGGLITSTVLLAPSARGGFSRAEILEVLLTRGFRPVTRDCDGYTMKSYKLRNASGNGWRIHWAGSDQDGRETNVPAMARALREAGYNASQGRLDGYPVVYVKP